MARLKGLGAFARFLWREHRTPMRVVAVASLALMLSEGAGLLLLVPVLGLVGVSVGDGAPDRMAVALDGVLRALGVTPNLPGMLALVVAVISARAGLQMLLAWWDARLEAAVVGRLRERLFEAVVRMPWARFAGERPAALLHAIGPQVDDVHSALLMLLQAVSLAAVVLAASLVAVVVSPVLTVAVVLAGGVLLVAARALRAPGRADGEQLLGASSGLFARIGELLNGMKMIHAHGAEVRAVAAVESDTRTWSALTQQYARRRAWVSFALAVLGVVMLALFVEAGVTRWHLAPATLLLLLLVYARLVPRAAELQSLASALSQALASWDSVTALLARCEAARDAQVNLNHPSAGDGSHGPRGTSAAAPAAHAAHAPAIELHDVTVRYPGAAEPALAGAVAHFAAGAFTVVVGASGAGKTTLADVLLGLLHPECGAVLVDGRPLAALDGARWRERVGYLAQDPMLMHGTIRDNLCFARPGATDGDLWTALEAAACDFVARLPRGLDAAVGDRGVMLSGGERQRIALARALLRAPDLLVLDEATSALDADTEHRVLDTVRGLSGTCTVVFCTHRDAVRNAADHVIALDSSEG